MIDLEQLARIRTSENASEEQYMDDKHMYLRGRKGYPEPPLNSLSERQRGCYMMGYSMSEFEDKEDL